MDNYLNHISDINSNISLKEKNNPSHPKVSFKLLDMIPKKGCEIKSKMTSHSSNLKHKNTPKKLNSLFKVKNQSNKSFLNINNVQSPSKSSFYKKNNLMTKSSLIKEKIQKMKSYDLNSNNNNNRNSPRKKFKYSQTKNNFLNLITKKNKNNNSIKEYSDSKVNLMYNNNFMEVLEGEALLSVEKKLQNKILDMGKEAEFMEFEIGPLGISINKFDIKKKKQKLQIKRMKYYEKNKKILKNAAQKKNICNQISEFNSNNLNTENIIIKSNQNLDESSKVFINENKKISSNNRQNLTKKIKHNLFNKRLSNIESGNSDIKQKKSNISTNLNSKVKSNFKSVMGISKTKTGTLYFPTKEESLSKSKTYSNLDSKISHNITDTPHYSGKISSISSDKQLIIINKEKFRILSRKKIVYDSLDDEESAEDVIIENFFLMPNSKLIIIVDSMVLIFSFWNMVYKPLSLVLNNCDLKNTITSITFDNITNLFIDILFIFDLIINFFKAYYNFDEQLITKSNRIFFHYIKGYFLIDIISAIPYYSIFKFIALFRYIKHGITVHCQTYYNHQIHDAFQIIELLKLIKLIKCISRTNIVTNFVMNSLNMYTFFENWSSIIFKICIFLLLLHLTACMHIFISFTAFPNWIISNNLDISSFPNIYLSSIYFLVATVTSVGYGDIIGKSFTEFCFQIILLIVGILSYSWMISSISNYVKENSKQNELFNRKLTMLKEIKLEHPNMSVELYDKIYLHLEYINLKQKKDKSALLESLPHTVKKSLLYEMYKPLIENFNFFKNFKNSEFINRVISKLKPIIAAKNDLLLDQGEIIEETFFVKQGRLRLEVKIDSNHPEISVQKLLNEEYFFGVENNELYQKNAFGIVNLTTMKTNLNNNSTIVNKKNLYDLYSRKSFAKTNITQKDIKCIMTNDQGKNEIQKHQSLNSEFIYLKILDIRKNEHFGALLMFLDKRSPLSLRVKTKKAELFFLKKIDAIEISSSYPNIWKRANKASFHNLKQIKNIMHKIIKHYCETYGINFMKTICKENNIKDINDLEKFYTLQVKNQNEFKKNDFSLDHKHKIPQRFSAVISKPQLNMVHEFINHDGRIISKLNEDKNTSQQIIKDLDIKNNETNNDNKKINSSLDSPGNYTLIKINEKNSPKELTYLFVKDKNLKQKPSVKNKIALSEKSKTIKIKNKKSGNEFYQRNISDEIFNKKKKKAIKEIKSDYNKNNEEVEYIPVNHFLSSQDSIKNNFITINDNKNQIFNQSNEIKNQFTVNNNFITNNVINNINGWKSNTELSTFHFGFKFKSNNNKSMKTFGKKNNKNNKLSKLYNLAIFKNSFELSTLKNEDKYNIDLKRSRNNIFKINKGKNYAKNILNKSFNSSKSFSENDTSNNNCSNSSCSCKNKEIKKIRNSSKKESSNKEIKNLSFSYSSSQSTIKQNISIKEDIIICRNQGFNLNAEYFNFNQLTNGIFSKIKKLQNYIKNILLKKISRLEYSKIELPKIKNIINSEKTNKIKPLNITTISKNFSRHIPYDNNTRIEKFKSSLVKNQKSNLFSSELNVKTKKSGIFKKKIIKKNNNNENLLNYVNRNIRDDSVVLNNPGKFYNGLFSNIMKNYPKGSIKQISK